MSSDDRPNEADEARVVAEIDQRWHDQLDKLKGKLPQLTIEGEPPYLDQDGRAWMFGVCLPDSLLLAGWRSDGTFESFVDVEGMALALRAFMQKAGAHVGEPTDG